MKTLKKLSPLFCLLLLVSSCSSTNVGEWISIGSSSVHVKTTTPGTNVSPFNTVFLLKYFENDKKDYDASFEEELKNTFIDTITSTHKEFDRHYSYYLNDSSKDLITNVKTINDSYGTNEWVTCSDELYDLIKQGHELTLLTDGYFNFYVGRLVDFWAEILDEINNYSDPMEWDPLYNERQLTKQKELAYSVPSLEEIQNIMSFDDQNKRVRFNVVDDVVYEGKTLERSKKNSPYRPLITSGGIAKGLAADYIKEALVKKNFTDGYINCGQSSISMLSNPNFTPNHTQKINIKDPRSLPYEDKLAFSLTFDYEFNLSTSGNYTVGHSYTIYHPETHKIIYRHHIIDPTSGDCSQYHSSVSIFSNTFSNAELDAFSTALVNLSTEDGLKFREKLLQEYPEHDLGIIFLDLNAEEKKVNLTITKEHKDIVEVKGQDYEVVYA